MRKRRAKTKTVYRYRRKRNKSKGSTGMFGGLKGIAMPLGAMLYGAGREKISDMVAQSSIGQKLPASQFTDEAVMLGLNWGARKFGLGKGLGASILNAGKSIEYARIGATAVDMWFNKNSTTNNTNNTGSLFDGGGY